MKKSSNKKGLYLFISFLLLFIVFTILVKVINVDTVGPKNSEVGFASLNKSFHDLFNYNETLYKISKILGYLSFLIIGLYGLVGLIQLIKRKSIFKVDKHILVLGAFYVIVLFVYAFFEIVIINYRPVLEKGVLEASYPSSHTILSICVCISSILVSKKVFKKNDFVGIFNFFTILLMFGIIVTRCLSGVHWLTDILGGIIISVSLCELFKYLLERIKNEK